MSSSCRCTSTSRLLHRLPSSDACGSSGAERKCAMFESLSVPFEEDHFPLGQDPIETGSVKQMASLARQIMAVRERTGYSTMGVVTGFPGVGKSIAIQAFLLNLAKLSHTGGPACIAIREKPDSTPKAFGEDLLLRL